MNSKTDTNRGPVSWVIFNKGPRVYFCQFQISDDGNTIRYGATIYKNTGTDIDFDQHTQTAKERFNRFPVTAEISAKIREEMEGVKTRAQKIIISETKKFQNFLIQSFVNNGVRHREGKNTYTSLRKKILDNRQAIIDKKKRVITNKTFAEIQRSEKQRKLMIRGFNPEKKGFHLVRHCAGNLPEINTKRTMNMVIWEEGNRIYHVDIQHNPVNGEARYGACVFKSTSIEDCLGYNRDDHIDTAVDRFENFPVFCRLPLNYGQMKSRETRSRARGEFPINDENLYILKKALCVFGVRCRSQENNFLKKVELLNKKSSVVKNLNRLQQGLDKEKAEYKKKTGSVTPLRKEKKVVFIGASPIILKRKNKVPTPPNSPMAVEVMDDKCPELEKMIHQKFEQKTTKGFKDKTKSITKRKREEEYRQNQIEKERRNSHKTKEKVNRRKMLVI